MLRGPTLPQSDRQAEDKRFMRGKNAQAISAICPPARLALLIRCQEFHTIKQILFTSPN